MTREEAIQKVIELDLCCKYQHIRMMECGCQDCVNDREFMISVFIKSEIGGSSVKKD